MDLSWKSPRIRKDWSSNLVLTRMISWSNVLRAWTGERRHPAGRLTVATTRWAEGAAIEQRPDKLRRDTRCIDFADGCWASLHFSTHFLAVLFCRCAYVPASLCSSTFCSKAINLAHFLISSLWEGSASTCTMCPANMCMEQGSGDY